MPLSTRKASMAALCAMTCSLRLAVRDGHDVDVVELRPGVAPVAVRQDGEAADLASRFDLFSFRHRPVKESVERREALARVADRLGVLEEGREAADHAALVERLGHD